MRRERLATIAVCAVGLVAFALVRAFHPVQTLGNPDIAGILYNADLLNDGLLPYKDSIDLKPPGAFFVVAAVFRLFGRDMPALHAAYGLFVLLGAGAIWVAARALHPQRSLGVPAAATALYAFSIAMFDMNYSSWMATPYAWSFALLLRGFRSGSAVSHAAAGALAMVSVLFKTQAVVLAPLFALVWLWARRRRLRGASFGAPLAWLGGATLAAAPLFVLYAANGAHPELVRGVFPIGEALEYTARMDDRASIWEPLAGFARRQAKAFGLPFVLIVACAIGLVRERRAGRTPDPVAPQLLFYLTSAWGCGIGGMRFYLHYLPQLLAAVALLAAHPAAWSWLATAAGKGASRTARVLASLHVIVLGGGLLFAAVQIPRGKANVVDHKGMRSAIEVGELIKSRTAPDDRVLCWGWSAWPVYYFADRRSPSAVFKVLGQVTEFNGDVSHPNGNVIHFRSGPLADRLLSDVEASPPAFVVRATPFFPGIVNEPLDEFEPLKRIFDERYRLVKQVGQLGVYQRID